MPRPSEITSACARRPVRRARPVALNISYRELPEEDAMRRLARAMEILTAGERRRLAAEQQREADEAKEIAATF